MSGSEELTLLREKQAVSPFQCHSVSVGYISWMCLCLCLGSTLLGAARENERGRGHSRDEKQVQRFAELIDKNE